MGSLVENDTVRTAVGAAGVFAGLVTFTGATVQSLAPVVILSAGMLAYSAADEAYALPNGTNGIAYGVGLIVAGVFLVATDTAWIGGGVVVTGCWFVFDGAMTTRYGRAQTPHNFVSGPESEALLRMQILNTVHQTLRNNAEPQTVNDIVEACEFSEPRVRSALEYLSRRDQVERIDAGYQLGPQKWGQLTPAARFISWVPRRVLRPFQQIRTD